MGGDSPTIVLGVADDDRREAYVTGLPTGWEVREAVDGREVLDVLDPTVDLLVLDSDLPGPSIGYLANRVATMGRDPHVAVLTEASTEDRRGDAGVHEYLRKPIEGADLGGVLAGYRARAEYEDALSEYFSLTTAVAAIEADRPRVELAEDERYERLRWLADEKGHEADRALRATDADWTCAFRAIWTELDSPGRPT